MWVFDRRERFDCYLIRPQVVNNRTTTIFTGSRNVGSYLSNKRQRTCRGGAEKAESFFLGVYRKNLLVAMRWPVAMAAKRRLG